VRVPAASRLTLFGLVVLALAALTAVAWLGRPVTLPAAQQSPPRPPPVAAVSVGARACPAPGTPGGGDTSVAVIAATRGGSGQATISRLTATGGGPGPALASLSQPGTLSVSSVPAAPAAPPPARGHRHTGTSQSNTAASQDGASQDGASQNSGLPTGEPGGVMIQATGSMAQGLEAEQTATGGAVTAGCAAPSTDFWFAMPGQFFAGDIRLYLMNTDGQASDVDVGIITDTGPLQTGIDSGITVPPHGLVVQSLAGLTHGSRAIGVHVHASAGRVVAAVSESTRAGQPGQWLPAAQAPAYRLVIPALPDSLGTRQLYVADPGGNDAAVRLSVVTAGGAYEPTGAGAIDIPAASAAEFDLPSLSGIAGAAVLTSNTPVVAAVVVPGGQADSPGAMAPAAPALQQQGVVADAGQRGDTTTLVLSAPGRAARVRLVTGASGVTSGGTAAGAGAQVISVPAQRSVTVSVPRPAGANQAFAIVLTPLPGSGPVFAGRVLAQAGGSVLDVMPVANAPVSVPLPGVRDALITAVP
jgi:hypothetical protein